MTVLRKVRDIELNTGFGAAKGLFNLSTTEVITSDITEVIVSNWFDEDTKDEFMKMDDATFWHRAKETIKEDNLD